MYDNTQASKVVHATVDTNSDNIGSTSKVVDMINDKASGNLVRRKNGSIVPIDSVLKEGKSSNRCRERKSKKKSVNNNVIIHKDRGNKKPGMK